MAETGAVRLPVSPVCASWRAASGTPVVPNRPPRRRFPVTGTRAPAVLGRAPVEEARWLCPRTIPAAHAGPRGFLPPAVRIPTASARPAQRPSATPVPSDGANHISPTGPTTGTASGTAASARRSPARPAGAGSGSRWPPPAPPLATAPLTPPGCHSVRPGHAPASSTWIASSTPRARHHPRPQGADCCCLSGQVPASLGARRASRILRAKCRAARPWGGRMMRLLLGYDGSVPSRASQSGSRTPVCWMPL